MQFENDNLQKLYTENHLLTEAGLMLHSQPEFTEGMQKIMQDFSTSDWLIHAIASSVRRDPVDALHDAEMLVKLLKERWEGMKGTPKSTYVQGDFKHTEMH